MKFYVGMCALLASFALLIWGAAALILMLIASGGFLTVLGILLASVVLFVIAGLCASD